MLNKVKVGLREAYARMAENRMVKDMKEFGIDIDENHFK